MTLNIHEITNPTVSSPNLLIKNVNEFPKTSDIINRNIPNIPDVEILPISTEDLQTIIWGHLPYHELFKLVNNTYDEIVHYRRNLLNIPSGKSGKFFITELSFWLKQFNEQTKLNGIAIKVFYHLYCYKTVSKIKSKRSF